MQPPPPIWKRFLRGPVTALSLLLTPLAHAVSPATGGSAPGAASLGQLPLFFEAHQGSPTQNSRFVARSSAGAFIISSTGATISLNKPAHFPQSKTEQLAERAANRNVRPRTVSMQFLGTTPRALTHGERLAPGKANYFIGADPSLWRTGQPLFERVRVEQIYHGVDLVYYGNQRQLEYDFVLAPGADPSTVSFAITGADTVQVDPGGDLVIKADSNDLRHHKPIAYQIIDGVRHEVSASYRLLGRETVGFQVGPYDLRWPLIIDPVLSYATFLGGTGRDTAWDVALDSAGNIYIAGETLSPLLPTTPGAFQRLYAGGYPNAGGDAFVAKFDNSGSNLLYLTYLGGNGDDAALGIAVDASGDACLTGMTDSTNFPVMAALKSTISGQGSYLFGLHPYDAFVAKLNPSGSALVYSTYLGGDTQDEGVGIAVDAQGNAYITGLTDSTNFPTVNAYQNQVAGSSDVFVTKINSNGTALVYSTYLGGTNVDNGSGIAVDTTGRAYITGFTQSTNFPTLNAFQPWLAGGQDVFVAALDASGSNLLFSTYFGGTLNDIGYRIALDSSGNPYVAGTESSGTYTADDFPLPPGNLNPGGVFKTTDSAGTWVPASSGLPHPRIFSLAIDPVTPNNVYAGTSRGLARSTDGGVTWDARILARSDSLGFAPAIAVNHVNALAVDRLAPNQVYAGTPTGLFQTSDFGLSWSPTAFELLSSGVSAVAVHPTNSSMVYLGTLSGIYVSTNSAVDVVLVNSGIPNVTAFAVNPAAQATVFAASYGGGMFVSYDLGANWFALNTGLTNLNVYSLALDPVTPTTLYAGTTTGVFKSANGGTNWASLSFGPGYTNLPVSALAADPATSGIVYAGTTNGLFKSSNSGLNWTVQTNGLADAWVSALALNPGSPSTVLAGTTRYGSISSSDAFVAKFDRDLGSLIFSTTFGGTTANQGWAIAVDGNGNSYIAGATSSTNFPIVQPSGFLRATNSGGFDAFVVAINADASAMLYSVLLGGQAGDGAAGIALDPAGNAYIVGQTLSGDFPVTNAFQPTYSFLGDAFLAKIVVQPTLAAALAGNFVQLSWPAFSPEFLLESTPTLGPPAVWSVVSQAPIVSNGFHTVTLPATNPSAAFRLRLH